MRGHRTVPTHTHRSFDVKPLGECISCDDFHERGGLTVREVESAFARALRNDGMTALRLLRILGELDPEKHATYLDMIKQGRQLADAVSEAMGEWPVKEPDDLSKD